MIQLPRPATVGDLATVLEIEESGFAPADRWSEAAWRAELVGDRIVLLAASDGVISWQVVADVADLLRVVVRPSARGQGIGRQLVDAGLRAVADQGAQRVLLEVATDNQAAIALYTGVGFVEIDRRRDYYGTGRDASIMELALGSVDD